MNVCANIMVKNEEARIERCLRSVASHVQSFVVCDTGSTDRTKELVAKVLTELKVRHHVVSTEFRTWDQARNDALDMARKLEPDSDYVLLMDADMELKFHLGFSFDGLSMDAYQMRQDSGTLSYMNVRVLRTKSNARYKGATHECLAVEGSMGSLETAWFVDHADGSNRKDKFVRDIKLLRDGLESDGLALRYMFYLAQSYHDNGQNEEALKWYGLRSEAGGWDEEAWFSRYMAGVCAKALGRPFEFMGWELKACATMPHRAEAWSTLAAYCREQGWMELCYMFSERALKCDPKSSGLFVDRAMYKALPMMDMSVSGFYVGGEAKEKARKMAFRMLVDPEVPESMRGQARHNVAFYLRGLADTFPGAKIRHMSYGIAEGVYGEMNPSIAVHPEGGCEINVRSANYRWAETGPMQCVILDGSGIIQTRNYYARLDGDLNVMGKTMMSTAQLPPPPFDSHITGFEDLRLFRWKGRLFATAMSTRHNEQRVCRQVLLELTEGGHAKRVVTMEYSPPGVYEKNWMPFVDGDEVKMIYKCWPFTVLKVDPETGAVSEVKKEWPNMCLDGWKGGSQAVPYGDGWAFVVHECIDYSDKPRVYWHRLVWMDKTLTVRKFTEPFAFCSVGIEYCAGMARWSGGLMMSFGMGDRKSALGWVSDASVEAAWIPMQ